MAADKTPRFLAHFAKHLFLASRVYANRDRAREDVNKQLQKMRKSIIRLELSFSDIDRLKKKIEALIDLERKYARIFKTEDNEVRELRQAMKILEDEAAKEREEKAKIISENNEKIKQLTESLENVKSSMRHLLMERAKRHQRLISLEKKINQKVDVHGYYQ